MNGDEGRGRYFFFASSLPSQQDSSTSHQPDRPHPTTTTSMAASGGGQRCRDLAVIKNAKYSDLTITIAERNTSYKVHKIYLALASPVFEHMIDSLLPAMHQELILHDTSPDALYWLLQYIYGRDPPIECHKLAVDVACLVGKYKVKSLHAVCVEWLEDILDKDTVLKVYNAAYLLRNSLLVTKCLQLLLTCADQVLSSEQVSFLSEESFSFLLDQSLYVKSEAVILNGLIAWGREKLPQHQRSCGTALHHTIKNLLPKVRILTLTAEEIVQSLIPSGVYSPEECQAILMHRTHTTGAPALPGTCSSLLTKRRCFDTLALNHLHLPGTRNAVPLLPCDVTNQECVIVSSLCVDASVVLQRVEGRSVELKKVSAAVRDKAGHTLYTSSMQHGGVFDVPVALDPSKVCSIVGKVSRDEWCEGMEGFSIESAGVHFRGEHTLITQGCDLYFWRLDQCIRVDL